jgi:ribosomal protein S18 acetylase RimI-like enzyme
MVVRPDHRDRGLGSRLLRHIIDHAKTNGFSRITLLTDEVNSDAVRFYRRHGFQPSSMTALRLQLNT